MRILYNNITDTGTISASPAMVTTLPETNLQNSYRERVARWTDVDFETITLTWVGAKPVGCVCLYRCNLTGTATWRIRVYSDAGLGTTVYDSGTINCLPATPFGSLEWGVDPLGQHLYTDWDYSVAVHWFPQVLGGGVTIDVDDGSNPDGYVEASRLFVGAYFEPECGVSTGMQLTWQENTKQSRTEGGTLRSEPGAAWRTLQMDLKLMDEGDRRRIIEIVRKTGMRNDLLVSVYPEREDELERDYMMQAKQLSLAPIIASTAMYKDHQLSLGEL